VIGSCQLLLALSFLGQSPAVPVHTPACVDDRLVIELVAREPDIVTPTGLAVDERGRVWVIENNTHERPANYQGPPSDRVRVFDDFDDNGHARRIHTFAEGFKNGMGLALGWDGSVYVATRSDIHLLRDTSNRGSADERRVIVKLETTGTYPHNGLSGLAFDPLGDLYFALGENLGAAYKLIGSDGSSLSGGGEGGSIYRCRPDGSQLRRVATGFWNTFHLTFDGFGRLFAVDNDPDSRGPCRLMHIVTNGDYGYRYRNGRKGLHPFTAWNGELPGTLPMVAGTSEAPCGVVAYESTGLPEEYRGDLLVTSWGDHLVERFKLVAKGASFVSQARPMIRGDENFRPVGIATAPDGSLYLSDWVDKSYPVHGKGRIWHIRMKSPPADEGLRVSQVAALDLAKLRPLLGQRKQEIRSAAGRALALRGPDGKKVLAYVLREDKDVRARLHALWAAATLERPAGIELISPALSDSASEVRAEAVHLLGGISSHDDKQIEERILELALRDPSAVVRRQAIAEVSGKEALEHLVPLLAEKDSFLFCAAMETLGRSNAVALLLQHVDATDPAVRIGVLLALRRAATAEGRASLPKFLADPDPGVRRAAIQWVGEERLHDLAPQLNAAAARPPVTREVFEALLATNEFLAGAHRLPTDEPSGEEYIAKFVRDRSQPAAIRAVALRMLRPDCPKVGHDLLTGFLNGKNENLRWEAAQTLALRADPKSQATLVKLARDPQMGTALRAEAVWGLALSAANVSAARDLLIASLDEPALRREALRSLRGAVDKPAVENALFGLWDKVSKDSAMDKNGLRELADQLVLVYGSAKNPEIQERLKAIRLSASPQPHTSAESRAALVGYGDPEEGRRVFFHANGPRCFACHRVDGRGGAIGPDLSNIGRGSSRDKLIESILEPSKEIAPQYVSWLISTRDGKLHTGVIVDEGPNSTITVADAQGKLEVINRTEVEERRALPTSIMPEKLSELMTRREFLDLIAFLESRK